uniref:F-box domain-containing protein n=1 Tax=Chenopodium quinoa TaxID=63459 RepID=A0A803LAH4_CHEQI
MSRSIWQSVGAAALQPSFFSGTLEQWHNNNLDPGHVQTMAEIDRISSLPDDLLSEIVFRLSVKEAATTCVLSKRWRDVFALITRLDIDDLRRDTLDKHNRFIDNALRSQQQIGLELLRTNWVQM